MSRPHDGHRPFFPSGNPFRLILPRGSNIPPKYATLLSTFEKNLAERFKNLKENVESEILNLSWMCDAMESLSETHTDIKNLITDLQFPISDWDGQWMDMYLDNSVKLLDICISFSSEISRLDRCQLLLRYALHVIDSADSPSEKQLNSVRTSLSDWMQQINSRNSKLKDSHKILEELKKSLYLPKAKNSNKGKILMRAMHGVKVQTIFVCTVFLAALMKSSTPLMDLQVSEKFLWVESFTDLQSYANREIRKRESCSGVLKLRDLEAVSYSAEKLLCLIPGSDELLSRNMLKENSLGRNEDESVQDGDAQNNQIEGVEQSVIELSETAEKFADRLDVLSKRVGDFFQIVLSGRDALLCNLRGSDVMQGTVGEDRKL
ncbi:unnamed protein product [Spirodela intermedia]|uniref:Uncharacterized protein n=1 Tax=Spirodela intermedia TaxID=51605 RepID=A0A7I8LC01_SPIIN|nr:unnamed protein product [Spirodela intermedia]